MGQAKNRGTYEHRVTQAADCLIRHYTTVPLAQQILTEGHLRTECRELSFTLKGFDHLWHQFNPSYGRTCGEVLQKDWQAIGQWVWLSTRAPRCNSLYNEVYFEFNALAIGARTWRSHCQSLLPTAEVKDAIRGVHQRLEGDDVSDWWIAPAIDLDKVDYEVYAATGQQIQAPKITAEALR